MPATISHDDFFKFQIACMKTNIERIREMGYDAPVLPKAIKVGFIAGQFSVGFLKAAEAYYVALSNFWHDTDMRMSAEDMVNDILRDIESMIHQAKKEQRQREFEIEYRSYKPWTWWND